MSSRHNSADLEPTLTRHGYRIKDLVEQFDARPTEIKALFSNQLDPTRTAELRDRMLRQAYRCEPSQSRIMWSQRR